MVNCSCCGQGIVEKCPLAFRRKAILNGHLNEVIPIATKSRCNCVLADFSIVTLLSGQKRRLPSTESKWILEDADDNLKHFFKYSILPEIIGKWLTRKLVADESGIVKPATG